VSATPAPSLAEVLAVVERLWPSSGAEPWDAVGLVSGDPAAPVEAILLAVDPVAATVQEAVQLGAGLLLCHHPLLLRGVQSVAEDRYKGALLASLIRAGCALVTAHTNADSPAEGVSDVLARLLGLRAVSPIVPTSPGSSGGLGRVGELPEPIALAELAERLGALLPPTAAGVRVAGQPSLMVQRVALCGGAGDSLLSDPAVTSADVYITADLRHHPASEAREQAVLRGGTPALIDVSHWASESLWLEVAAQTLRSALPAVRVQVSSVRTDPWDFVAAAGRLGERTVEEER